MSVNAHRSPAGARCRSNSQVRALALGRAAEAGDRLAPGCRLPGRGRVGRCGSVRPWAERLKPAIVRLRAAGCLVEAG
jgi:hypothetical protein